MNLIERFISFQHHRFPLRILIFTTLSSVLASAAVSGNIASFADYSAAFFVCLFLVYHIRVIDESRDQLHDNTHYPDRPVNKGTISLKELFIIDIVGLLVTLIIALLYGKISTIWLLAFVLFTTLAWKDFYLSKFISNKPLLYHLVNSPQMVLIQLLLYSILSHSIDVSEVMWIQILLLYLNILILEMVRKIKLTEETTAQDTYSKSKGYINSLLFALMIVICIFSVFCWLILKISVHPMTYIFIGAAVAIFSVISIISHIYIKSKTSEKFMLLSSLLVYICLNTVLYLSVI